MLKTKRIIKIVTWMLVAVFALLSFAACGEETKVLSCGGQTVSEEIYQYWYIQLKQYYLDSYSDLIDDEEFWRSEIPDGEGTYGDFLDDKIRTQIDYYLAGILLFDQHELKSKLNTAWKAVVSSVDEEIDDGINAFGSRSEYDKYLVKKYGIDSSVLRDAKLMEQMFYLAYDYFYNTKTGLDTANDSEIAKFYQDNYARIKYYMVLKNFEYRVDANGNRVVDSKGNYIQDALTDAEKAEKTEYANKVFNAIKDGTETIDSYVKKDFPDLIKGYPNGYYVLSNEQYGYLFTTTIIKAAFGMEIGDTVICENDDAYFIVQRFELVDNAYKGSDSAQFTDIGYYASNSKFEKKFGEVIKTIERNEEIIEKYSVITVD